MKWCHGGTRCSVSSSSYKQSGLILMGFHLSICMMIICSQWIHLDSSNWWIRMCLWSVWRCADCVRLILKSSQKKSTCCTLSVRLLRTVVIVKMIWICACTSSCFVIVPLTRHSRPLALLTYHLCVPTTFSAKRWDMDSNVLRTPDLKSDVGAQSSCLPPSACFIVSRMPLVSWNGSCCEHSLFLTPPAARNDSVIETPEQMCLSDRETCRSKSDTTSLKDSAPQADQIGCVWWNCLQLFGFCRVAGGLVEEHINPQVSPNYCTRKIFHPQSYEPEENYHREALLCASLCEVDLFPLCSFTKSGRLVHNDLWVYIWETLLGKNDRSNGCR